jgi:D-3-phosphoglycerate dehydrogenase
MTEESPAAIIGVTAGNAFDLSIEREVFDGKDVELRPVDVATSDDLIDSLHDVDGVIDRLLAAPYTSEVMDAFADCKVIARCGIGVDQLDVKRAAERGIYVVNVPTYCQNEVSEHAILLMLALQRNLTAYDAALKDGTWEQGVQTPVHRLHGQTLGLIGYGTIARLVAEKALAFGMDVVASDPYVDAAEMEADGVEKASFEGVLEAADVVSLHAPLLDETAGMMDTDVFSRMKDSAYLVNVSRGGLVVEDDLVTALKEDQIAGAGLDVFEHEPSAQGDHQPSFENPLRKRDNVVLTPHVAWYSEEANDERRRKAAMDVRRVLDGEQPENPVNEPQ